METGDAVGAKPPPPCAHRRLADLKAQRGLPIAETVFGQQHDLRRRASAAGKLRERAIASI
jgi:hypothetical protein